MPDCESNRWKRFAANGEIVLRVPVANGAFQ
jgi:hypothetical protein